MANLQELGKSKPRGKADENLIAEISRLESAKTVTKDDLVRAERQYRDSILLIWNLLGSLQVAFEQRQRRAKACR